MSLPLPQVSIIMPVLDEADGLARMLAPLQHWRAQGHELIVVDGGSGDATMQRATGLCDALVSAPRGRARQMNAGAARATGAVLLFLHADTRLPEDAAAAIAGALAQGACWGRFDVRIEGRYRMFALIAAMMNLRSRLSGIATGDQAMFVTRETFCAVGGFPDQPLMEDIALSEALRRRARPACLRSRVRTSGRRWEQHGLWRTIVLMWRLRAAYALGADPAELARRYGYHP
jgi:rSAM/selenodomain-associated transferase 2